VTGPVVPQSADSVNAASKVYEQARTRARVLLAVDRSGSMSAPVGDGTRFAVASRAVQDSLNLMGPQDQFGLWVFGDDAKTPRELTSIGAGTQERRIAATAGLTKVAPAGQTPLYQTIIDALGQVPGDDHQVGAVIVFTDGEDTGSLSPASVQKKVKEAHGRRTTLFLVAAGEARCDAPPLSAIAPKRCFQTDFGNVRNVLSDLAGQLWGAA
jgi:uncharacterized protein with von Willebrand factor type A (vWA) domain